MSQKRLSKKDLARLHKWFANGRKKKTALAEMFGVSPPAITYHYQKWLEGEYQKGIRETSPKFRSPVDANV
jgi:DNA-binding Lrp family transcriptional regulator